MFMSMALHDLFPLILFIYSITTNLASCSEHVFNCTDQITRCNALLYHSNSTLPKEQIASYYSVNPSQINPIQHLEKQDYLISVPCSCQNISGTVGYFYNTSYQVEEGDTFFNVSSQIYNGQAWNFGDETLQLNVSTVIPIYLLCGCVANTGQIVVTYTVQSRDTLFDIAATLSAHIDGIQRLNGIANSSFIEVGDVLYVPREINGTSDAMKDTSTRVERFPDIMGDDINI